MSLSPLAVSWEAVYDDGFVYRESDGGLYGQIDRNRLREFRLVAPGEILVTLSAQDGRTGWNLVYRRRSIHSMSSSGVGSKQIWFVLGWVPQGPIISFNPETLQAFKADRFEGGAGPMGAVTPRPQEGETWDLSHMIHKSDAVLKPNRIVTPSGYVMGGQSAKASAPS